MIDEPEQTVTLAPGATTVGVHGAHHRAGTPRRCTCARPRRRRPPPRATTRACWRSRPNAIPASSASKAAPARRDRSRARWRVEHIAADVRAARGLPRDFDFGRYDLVVLADVPRAALARRRRWRRWTASCARAAGCWSRAARRASARADTWRRASSRCCPCGSTSPSGARRRRWRWRWSSTGRARWRARRWS